MAVNKKKYWQIFAWLTILTALEVGVVYIPGISMTALISCLILMAIGKAALVAYYFMHLNHETKLVRNSVTFCLAIPAVYAIALIGEAAWRLLA